MMQVKKKKGCRKCNYTGYVQVDGDARWCECRLREWVGKQLKPFKRQGVVPGYVKQYVYMLLWRHEVLEHKLDDTIRKHWYMIDPYYAGKKTEATLQLPAPREYRQQDWYKVQGHLHVPKFWYRAFMCQYVISTNYEPYRIINTDELTTLYHTQKADMSDGAVHFYGFPEKTLFLICNTNLVAKNTMSIIQQFIEFYIDRNVIIYADNRYNDVLKLFRVTDGAGHQAYMMDGVSLRELLETTYSDTYMDIRDLAYSPTGMSMYKDLDVWCRKSGKSVYKLGDLEGWLNNG